MAYWLNFVTQLYSISSSQKIVLQRICLRDQYMFNWIMNKADTIQALKQEKRGVQDKISHGKAHL